MNSARTERPEVRRFIVGPLGTNCYLVFERPSMKGVLIDPGEADSAVKEAISSEGVTVDWVINTHGHADHIKGNAYFSYPVAIHSLDEGCLSDPARNLSFQTWPVEEVKAGRLLSDGDIISAGGLSFEVLHTPGHTPGGICLKCGEMLFSGDTLFFEGVGRTDLPGGDYNALVKSIEEKLFSLPDLTQVFPGHGVRTTIGHEKQCNPFMGHKDSTKGLL
jgi:hydroxyacylglutathione hydrolase